jgi:hypothetical protein
MEYFNSYVSFSGFGGNNSDGNALIVTITLELAQSGEVVLEEDLSDAVSLAEFLGIALDLDTAISNIINDNEELSIVSTVTHSGEVGTQSDTCVWTFVNTEDPNNNVINMSIDFNTQADIIVNTEGIFDDTIADIFSVYINQYGLNVIMNMLGGLFDQAELLIQGYYTGLNLQTLEGNILNIQTQTLNSITTIPNNIKIIGYYGFSDYLVLFAKWPLL